MDDGWVGGWMGRHIKGYLDRQMMREGWMDDGYMMDARWMDVRMDGWWVDGWKDG